MPRSHKWVKTAIGAAGFLLVAVAVLNYFRVYCCAPIHLRLSGGNVCPLRSEMARTICSEVHNAGIVLESATGTNSEAVCAAVNKGEIDLGLVLGGFPPNAHPNVRQVAVFGVEPLHLLVRPELLQGKPPTLEILRGRFVSLGEQGTNGSMLAESLMRLSGLRPSSSTLPGDFKAAYIRERDLWVMLRSVATASAESRASFAAILPDAVFLVDSLPAPLVDRLVKVAGYELVPLPYATAMHLDSRRNHHGTEDLLDNSRLEATTIPACAYGINPPMPPADCKTFGLRLMLVANRNVSPTAVLRLLRALDSGVTERYHIKLQVAEQYREFAIHPGAQAFAQGRKPLMLGELVEPVGNLLSVLGAGGAGMFAIWRFVRGLRAVHPDFHLRQIDRIERLLRGDEQDASAPSLPADFIDYLEGRLAAIKQAAINDYAAHRLQGDEAFMSILTMIADTRHLLNQRRDLLLSEFPEREPHSPRRLSEAA
jgi:TRAP-type uncharacterized transport system substrate-binding protein